MDDNLNLEWLDLPSLLGDGNAERVLGGGPTCTQDLTTYFSLPTYFYSMETSSQARTHIQRKGELFEDKKLKKLQIHVSN